MISLNDFTISNQFSTLAIRLAYNSNITATGRPFAFGSFGLNSGFTYLHQTGLYADLNGYLSPEYAPSYFLTTTTVGYLHSVKKGFSFSAEYSRYFYNLSDESSIAYNGNFALTGFFIYKDLILRAEYNLFHGTKIGHRLSPSISLNLVKEKVWKFDKIQFWPGTQLLFGTEKISEYIPYSRDPRIILERTRRGLPLFYESISTQYGLMNAAFSLPVNLQKGNWNMMLNYSYNIPVALPGETLGLTSGGFFSLSLTRYFGLN